MDRFQQVIFSLLEYVNSLSLLGLAIDHFLLISFMFLIFGQIVLIALKSVLKRYDGVESAKSGPDSRNRRGPDIDRVMPFASGALGGAYIFISSFDAIGTETLPIANLVSIALFVFSFLCIWIAANRTPKKLLIAVGAGMAFVLGAFLFEMTLRVIAIIESAPT